MRFTINYSFSRIVEQRNLRPEHHQSILLPFLRQEDGVLFQQNNLRAHEAKEKSRAMNNVLFTTM